MPSEPVVAGFGCPSSSDEVFAKSRITGDNEENRNSKSGTIAPDNFPVRRNALLDIKL
jgi:hypothetical protein